MTNIEGMKFNSIESPRKITKSVIVKYVYKDTNENDIDDE